MADPVRIVKYDPKWPDLFQNLGKALREALGETAIRIDHIGSTSIRGLDAKPIIDIQISVSSFDPLEKYCKPIESIGFVYRADNLDLTKRYFREKPGERRTHIHVRRVGSFSEQFALLFRDYLRVHDEDAKEYASVKYELAKKYQDDRLRYTEGKSPIFWAIMMEAYRWSQELGWCPGLLDA
jgi:GrpB-like predicted nucleotidyltransferase (UPF0157 family)